MAFKLTKSEEAKLEALKTNLSNAFGELETTVAEYNKALEEPKAAVEHSLALYNSLLSEFRSFVNGVAEERRDEYEDKSDGWKEGDNASTIEEWISTWEGADLEDVTITFPDELDLDFEDHADTDLPGEP